MNWLKKALILTIILLIAAVSFTVVMHQQIVRTSVSTQIADMRDDKLGTLCGEVFGAGAVIIWFVCYKTRSKP